MRFTKIFPWLLVTIAITSCHFPDPDKAKDLNSKGLQYSAAGKKKEAIRCFLEASRTEGITTLNHTFYLQNIGSEYWYDNVDSAKYYYTQAAKLNRKGSYAWLYSMANFYVLNNQTDKALRMLLNAYKLDSMDMQVNNLIGLMLMGEYGESHYDPERALKYNQRSYDMYGDVHSEFALAKNYYLIHDTENSVPLFEDICKKSPDNTSYLSSLIMIYQELGRTEDANKLLAVLKKKDLTRYEEVMEAGIEEGQHTITWNH